MKRFYQRELEEILDGLTGRPKLFLHSCCGPCSSYVLEYLDPYFEITIFYDNPNIQPESEYRHRLAEQKKVIDRINPKIRLIEGDYDPKRYAKAVQGLEHLGEGTERCWACYELRMREACQRAKEEGMDYYATTLSISPYKNADKINEIGERIAKEVGIPHLPSDFKKRGGYQRSIELSKEWGIYRQDYCGCIYSLREEEERRAKKAERERSSH